MDYKYDDQIINDFYLSVFEALNSSKTITYTIADESIAYIEGGQLKVKGVVGGTTMQLNALNEGEYLQDFVCVKVINYKNSFQKLNIIYKYRNFIGGIYYEEEFD